jgi:hypothetical protein
MFPEQWPRVIDSKSPSDALRLTQTRTVQFAYGSTGL